MVVGEQRLFNFITVYIEINRHLYGFPRICPFVQIPLSYIVTANKTCNMKGSEVF
jgi:hypothetical protein